MHGLKQNLRQVFFTKEMGAESGREGKAECGGESR